jgi:hypothetical protein
MFSHYFFFPLKDSSIFIDIFTSFANKFLFSTLGFQLLGFYFKFLFML